MSWPKPNDDLTFNTLVVKSQPRFTSSSVS